MKEQDRIDFIKKIPGYESINPYLNHSKLIEVKTLLHKFGFYKNQVWTIPDSSILNLILKAQGKTPYKKKSKSYKYILGRVYIQE